MPFLCIFIHTSILSSFELVDTSFLSHHLEIEDEMIITCFEKSQNNHFHIHYQESNRENDRENDRETDRETPSKRMRLRDNSCSFQTLTSIEEIENAHYCGQVFQCYLICDLNNYLFIIDQVFSLRLICYN